MTETEKKNKNKNIGPEYRRGTNKLTYKQKQKKPKKRKKRMLKLEKLLRSKMYLCSYSRFSPLSSICAVQLRVYPTP